MPINKKEKRKITNQLATSKNKRIIAIKPTTKNEKQAKNAEKNNQNKTHKEKCENPDLYVKKTKNIQGEGAKSFAQYNYACLFNNKHKITKDRQCRSYFSAAFLFNSINKHFQKNQLKTRIANK